MSKEENLADAISSAELEKINLEIQQLRSKRAWHDRIPPYTTLLSVLIAVGGFLFGIYQFQRQQKLQFEQRSAEQQKDRVTQERELSIRIQNQIRSDLDQILKFTEDKEQTVARVTFLIDDLKTYLNLDEKRESSKPEDTVARSRKISVVLVKTILNDCNFDKPRDVRFATTLLNEWNDVGQYLKENPTYHARIFDKLADAILKVYLKDPKVISSVQPIGEKYWFRNGYGALAPADIFHFQDMVESYVGFFEVLDDSEMKETKALRFQMATCNPEATKTYFKINFDPNKEGALQHCLKGSQKRGY